MAIAMRYIISNAIYPYVPAYGRANNGAHVVQTTCRQKGVSIVTHTHAYDETDRISLTIREMAAQGPESSNFEKMPAMQPIMTRQA